MADNNDKKMKTTLRIIGEINVETLKTFFDDTDLIIEEYSRFKAESSLVKPAFLQQFPPITIEISSYGGCTDCGSAIIHRMDEMKNMGIEVNTHCHFAYSMAFIIYVNGMKRTGDKLSKFMNHGSASYNKGYVEEQRSSIEFSTKCDEQFEQIIYDNTKMPKERVEKARLCYDWIAYEEAKELGIINYYEGCELEEEDTQRKMVEALQSSIEVFSQLLEIDEEEGINLMCDLLFTAMEMGLFDEETETETDEKDCEEVEEEDVDVEIEDDEEELDENKLAKTLSEILNEAMDEDEEE